MKILVSHFFYNSNEPIIYHYFCLFAVVYSNLCVHLCLRVVYLSSAGLYNQFLVYRPLHPFFPLFVAEIFIIECGRETKWRSTDICWNISRLTELQPFHACRQMSQFYFLTICERPSLFFTAPSSWFQSFSCIVLDHRHYYWMVRGTMLEFDTLIIKNKVI